jgi:hypothetical protein
MSEWPPIAEPELLRRLTMDDAEFDEFFQGLVERLPARTHDEVTFARAIAYPWARPAGSFLLSGGETSMLAHLGAGERDDALARFLAPDCGRLPVLAIGSNGAPETVERKFAHFERAEDRSLLAVTGHLHDFDVGVAAQPSLYGSMAATPFPSPGTATRASLLWVTPAQFTQLAWSELTYRLGRLRTRFEADDDLPDRDEVLVFVSRFGAFCPDGEPVALAAVPARGRVASELSQEQSLDAAARLALGPEASAEDLVRAIFEDPSALVPKLVETVNRASLPFASERWTPFHPELV